MKKTEDSKETLDDSIQLAIRDEVEKRVEQRESIYWKFGGLFVTLVVLFFAILWKVSISEVRETVEKQLAEQEVIKARDRIMAINSAAEDMNRNLIAISTSMNTNQQSFLTRLNQIKQQDNVVLTEDLSKLFVVQAVTNLTGGNKIILDYEPIPHTIALSFDNAQYKMVDAYGHSEGKTFIISSEAVKTMADLIVAKQNLKIQYVRKSLR